MTDLFKRFLEKHPRWQQERSEIDAVVTVLRNKIGDIKTYLEVGTAEGGSVYYFGHLLGPVKAVCVDLDENHTRPVREWVFEQLQDAMDIKLISGNSTDQAVIDCVKAMGSFDVVFIDGGHDYATAKSDWDNYGQLGTKAVVFHDICLPDVRRLWDEIPGNKLSLIGSGKFGMGILFR